MKPITSRAEYSPNKPSLILVPSTPHPQLRLASFKNPMPDTTPEPALTDTPQHFFKFSNAEGVKAILDHKSIFVTSPLDLNDPFEMRPAWTQEHEDRYRDHQNHRNRMMEGLPIIPATNDGQIHTIGHMPAQPELETVSVDNQYGTADIHNEQIFRVMFENFRVLSFATHVCDITLTHTESAPELTLMWSHYADMFQGACVVFDSDKLPQGNKDGGHQVTYGENRKSLPADYYDTYLQADCFEHGGIPWSTCGGIAVPKASQNDILKDRFMKILTAKSPAWKYEDEWRLIYEMSDSSIGQHLLPCDVCNANENDAEKCEEPYYRDKISFPPDSVVAVLFGVDISHNDTQDLLTTLSQEHYSHVSLFFSGIDSEKYAVKYSKQDPEYISKMQKIRSENFNKAKRHSRLHKDGIGIAHLPKGVCKKIKNPFKEKPYVRKLDETYPNPLGHPCRKNR